MTNDVFSSDHPVDDIAVILAMGWLRLREKYSAFSGPEREIPLDFSGPSEPSWTHLKKHRKNP